MEKRDCWAPVTPEKVVGMKQNRDEDGNWEDLLGIYAGVLLEKKCEGQRVGDVVPPPKKVNCLAELLGNSNGTLNAAISQDETKWNNCIPVPNMPSSGLSVAYQPSYNLNLPQRSENGNSSSVEGAFHLRPGTPDQHYQISQIPHLSIEENNKRDNFVLPQQAEIGGREHNNDFVSSSPSTASPDREKQNLDARNQREFDLNETPPQKTPKRRKHRPKVVVEGKRRRTPRPAAKANTNPGGDPPAKRKYVCKTGIKPRTNQSVGDENGVLNSQSQEKSCKRALNFDLENVGANTNPGGDPPAKRKYVRKKGIKTPTNQTVGDENGVLNSQSQEKSCKRALNFDLENVGGKKMKSKEFDPQEENSQESDPSINVNLEFHNVDRQGTCIVKTMHQNVLKEKKQTDFVDTIPPQGALPPAATVPQAAQKKRTLNVIARSLNARSTNTNQCGTQGTYSQVHHHLANLDAPRQPRLQSTSHLLDDLVGDWEKKEPTRAYSYPEPTQPLMVSQICSRGVSETGHFKKESMKMWQSAAESSITKTKHATNKICGVSTPSGNSYTEDFREQNGSPRNMTLDALMYRLHMNGRLPNIGIELMNTLMNQTYETNKVTLPWFMNSISSELGLQKQIAGIESHPSAEAQQDTNSLTAVANCEELSTSHRYPNVINRNEMTDTPAPVLAKRQYTRRTPSNKRTSTDNVTQQETRNMQCYTYESTNVSSGSQEYKRNIFSVDDITDIMKNLRISNSGSGAIEEEQNALVRYTGDGIIIPYEAFEPVKKRLPRPKVDLDPETNRLWNLLMGSEGSENAETMDEEKQKRWDEERRVFRGRVDSFIARMHLVQGDRRFSKWKGSVVDSVIGVYLTQNVTDHLSSSAFMSLAARFPIKSTNISDTLCQKAGKPSDEYVVLVSHPDGTTFHQQMTREPVYNNTFSKLSDYGSERVPSCIFSVNKQTRRMEDQIVSSQSSSESMSFQASEDIRSNSGSTSEIDDQVTGSNLRENCGPLYLFKETGEFTAFQESQIQELGFSFPDKRPLNDHQEYENLANRNYPGGASSTNAYTYPLTTNVRHHQRPAPTSESTWQGMLMDTEDKEIDVYAFLEKECTSSLTSTLCETTCRTVIDDLHNKSGQRMENMSMESQSVKFQASKVIHKVLTKHLEKKTSLPFESESRDNQNSCKLGGLQESFHQERSFLTGPVKSAEAPGLHPTDNQKPSENITTEPTEMKTPHAADVESSKVRTDSTARKPKDEKEQVKSFDWDSLRKQVQSKGVTPRSRDIMDSLDYEALRNADVREISDSIKERGMNNMLAARIKDFLNRLVKDHGSIDLEWLRDVQPDKVKDYLLSIRGLGLKSVECIRLLTLHHLAFPVDTNVGRIAVRLGWVPLQPLPESLQLHLLELYPVLESIQKYLWPRLCMLDQETLYELHYQLITFGKVFCTKRQPNCNACPMRGECRHFASAFASARFALPGPEERRVVCSEIPTSSSKSCGVVPKPMSLLPAEDHIGSSPGFTRNCRNSEPIIEEPATPESSIEVTETDIEDAFYEDPDEIPEIKLNIEEFTTNLKSFIQENNEMQEGDMSKAIIALSPQFASIPTPKLKHVSRLRTEHQVYELPDSHPLLEGMDRREPDDPSPYLLALWTTGETADSIQLSESKCSSSESGMCNDNTCFPCNSTREAQTETVRGTILVPCRTAMRGSFPLNGTYFQVNEVFADDETSMNPIQVPRSLIWNLPRRTVFFGTSVSTIFKGMSTEGIQYCFWRGFICVRGFDQKTRAPRPLKARLHLPASKIPKKNE